MPVVELPIEWTGLTGGERRVATTGNTVGECLASLFARFPRLVERLDVGFEVFANWENVRLREGEATPVGVGDTIQVIPTRP